MRECLFDQVAESVDERVELIANPLARRGDEA
jgi:hypothetical protein